ncbi:MAG: 4-(cytidine 5'-diphospho)-2-C-methyl-D-erythritol kinase [Deltaproteobacteria bacterium]|nr:4-(cytidine 5'-diphospho)-2-C-methyl-D-erythritol kinase [Deltaproteobacteria bacterium]
MELRIAAPAKVNLSLHVVGRRPDGYHELLTLMQPLDLCDHLQVTLGGEGCRLFCDRAELAGEDNLVLRAARAYFAALGLPGGATFRLEKNIPVAAGLGGGSSDAAAALLALNALYGGVLPPQRLWDLARGLGADVSFFLAGCTALCTGIGDQVHPWPEFPSLSYVLVNPGFAVSTAWVYSEFDLTWTKPQVQNKLKRLLGYDKRETIFLHNDLELVTLSAYPELRTIKEVMEAKGAWGTLLSGSGPTLFGIFTDFTLAQRAAAELSARGGWWVRACQGIANAPLERR